MWGCWLAQVFLSWTGDLSGLLWPSSLVWLVVKKNGWLTQKSSEQTYKAALCYLMMMFHCWPPVKTSPQTLSPLVTLQPDGPGCVKIRSSPFSPHCSACHIVCSAALEIQAYNPLSALIYEHFTYILMWIITRCYKYLHFHTNWRTPEESQPQAEKREQITLFMGGKYWNILAWL